MAGRGRTYTTQQSVRPEKPAPNFYRAPKDQPQPLDGEYFEGEVRALKDTVKKRSAKVKRQRGRQ